MTAPSFRLTDKLAAMIQEPDRKANRILLPEERDAKAAAGEEKQLQRDAENYLRSAKGIRFVWHEVNSRGNRAGVPDLLFCFAGHAVGIELKTCDGKTSDAQDRVQEEMAYDGWRVAVCRSIPEIKAFLAQLEFGETENKETR